MLRLVSSLEGGHSRNKNVFIPSTKFYCEPAICVILDTGILAINKESRNLVLWSMTVGGFGNVNA